MPIQNKNSINNKDYCKTGCCCTCKVKSTQRRINRRKEIPEISSPLRPEQISYALSYNKAFDEHCMPSAWIAPFPPTTDKYSSTVIKSDSHYQLDPFHQRISPSLITTSPLNITSTIPGSQLNEQGKIKSNQYDHYGTSLVCSLSAELASVGRHRFCLTYITDRLLVVSYPPEATKTDHNEGARWLCKAFEKRYGENYKIFNLSGFTKELHFSSRTPVIDLFWNGSLAPALEQLITAIDQLDYWLHNHDIPSIDELKASKDVIMMNNRVAVLHCTGPKCLLATYLAVYICQSKARFGPMYGQRPGSPTASGLLWNENRLRRFKHELVLGHTIMKKFYEDNLARELNPSQKRYVKYFSSLLTGALILQDRLVYLHAIVYRDSSRGRYLGQPLETIIENTNDNSLYAQPNDVLHYIKNTQTIPLQLHNNTFISLHHNDYLLNELQSTNNNNDINEFDSIQRWNQIFTNSMNLLQPSITQQLTNNQSNVISNLSTIKQLNTFVDNECGLFLKIYQNLNLMHTTRILCPNVNFRMERYIFPIEPVLPLHGDVLIACYMQPNFSVEFQELLFRAQFHTCAVDAEKLSFFKVDLDEACEKTIFPSTGCVELYFTSHHELITEHTDNIERGCYIWTTADRESNILSTQHQLHHEKSHHLSSSNHTFTTTDNVNITSQLNTYKQLNNTLINTTSTIIPKLNTTSRQALHVLITSKEQLINVTTSGYYTQCQHKDQQQTTMWSVNHSQEITDSSKPNRLNLTRQTSDPLCHPVIRGRSPQNSTQWINKQDALNATKQIPLYQQALLSPRVKVPQSNNLLQHKSSVQPDYTNILSEAQQYQSQQQITSNQPGGQIAMNRSNLAQLQSLYQQLLQQHQQLLQQQQRQQPHPQQQQTLDYATGLPVDSGLYATVQRPQANIPNSLVASLQRVILQQQQLQQQQQQQQQLQQPPQLHIPQSQPSMVPGICIYPQAGSTIQPLPALNLSGLSTSSAFTNLARALLPSSITYNAGDLLTAPSLPNAPYSIFHNPNLMPSSNQLLPSLKPSIYTQQQQQQAQQQNLLQNFRLPSAIESSYLSSQARLGGPSNVGLIGDVGPTDLLSDPSWQAEQKRRLDLQRTRFMLNEQERKLFEELKNIRNRRAGLSKLEQSGRSTVAGGGTSGLTPLESYRRATKRISTSEDARIRGRNRPLYAIGRSGSADTARLPLGSGGNYLYGDAYTSDIDEDSALLAILEQRLSRKPDSRRIYSDSEMGLQDTGDIPLRIVGHQQRSGHVVDGSSQAFTGPVIPGEQNEDLELFPRRPRIQVVHSPVEASSQIPNELTRGRTYSGSPTMHQTQGSYPKSRLSHVSPTKRHFWGHSSYDEQWSRQLVDDGPTNERSSCTSPVQTHSGRLLRSPVSPPPRGYIRRPSEMLDGGSQSDTAIMSSFGGRVYHPSGTSSSAHDQPVRRPYKVMRGKTTDMTKRSRPTQIPTYRSPEDHKPLKPKHPVPGGLEHIPDNALVVLSRISASAHIWYHPEMSRNDAMDLIRSEAPGTFVVRNSGSFPHSFGLVVKVHRHHAHGTNDETDSIRHYLIECLQLSTVISQTIGVSGDLLPSSNIPMNSPALSVIHEPVRLRGSSNEPIFTNLVSLIYEHTIQSLALPCLLRLPFKMPTLINNLPSLLVFSTKGLHSERISPTSMIPKYATQLTTYTGRDSPRDIHRIDKTQGALLRHHPSETLPSDLGSYEIDSSYNTTQLGMPPSMHHPTRQDDFVLPTGSKSKSSRSPSAVYEGELGPLGPPDSGRTFTSIYLGSIDTENLTGSSAIRKAVDVLLENAAQVKQTEVTIRVSQDGLTVTDNWRKLFFRRNYPFHSVSFCAIDPFQRCWESPELRSMGYKSSLIFGFIARKQNTHENMCHVLCDTPECNAYIITDYIMHRLNEY